MNSNENKINLLDINESTLIDNMEIDLYKKIHDNLKECEQFFFNVSFVKFSGVQMILDELNEIKDTTFGKILTTNYLNSTEEKALKKLDDFSNIDVRVYDTSDQNGYHPKTYIFNKKDNTATIIIGSSNLTESGIRKNIEWNIEFSISQESPIYKKIIKQFNWLWDQSKENYQDVLKKGFDYFVQNSTLQNSFDFKENKMQIEALKNLEKMRNENLTKALIIAATGTGKTYLAAMDAKNAKAKKILFIAHRHEIIKDAKELFLKVFTNSKINIDNNSINDYEKYDIFFITVQTLYKDENYKKIKEDYFDYIILDEAHHSASDSYQHIFEYFNYNFLLGLTATPERMDGKDIFQKFDYNVAYQLRLKQALDENLLCSFHYFGVIDNVDWTDIDITNYKKYENLICVEERVDFIIEKINFYDYSGDVRKCLGFCASKKHAQFMHEEFKLRGYKSNFLTSDDSKEKRKEILDDLKKGEIEFLFCVDILNEGIDIPEVNTILMLRPTESPTIFIQQLGRGLRKVKGKEFVTIIDLIGNHNNILNMVLAFNKFNLFEKNTLEKIVKNDFLVFSKSAFIHIDEISKKHILDKIESVIFNSKLNLQKSYKELKKELKRIPNWLDFIEYENYLDIEYILKKLTSKSKTYYGFLTEIIGEKEIENIIDENEIKILSLIESFVPSKRPDEFLIIKHIIYNYLNKNIDNTSINEINNKLNISLEKITFILDHLFVLKQHDKNTIGKYESLIKLNDGKYFITPIFKSLLEKSKTNNWLESYLKELIEYGINSFYQNIAIDKKRIDDLFIGSTYSKNEILLCINYKKPFSSVREGIINYNNQCYLLITLDKNTFQAQHKYHDEILDDETIKWQSQNTQNCESKLFKEIIETNKNFSNFHIFVRNTKEDKKKENKNKYIYLGKAYYYSHNGNNPITFKLKLINPINEDILFQLK